MAPGSSPTLNAIQRGGAPYLELDRLELRLVAGRQLPAAASYHLLTKWRRLMVWSCTISTWDGFLAEIERIAVG